MTTPVVLIHGGGFDSRCWDLLLPHLDGPTLAVDLPGRGRHPADLRTVDIAACAESVAADVDAAGTDEIVLVGHSMAGVTMPAVVGLLGDRVRHLVYIACTVPEHGTAVIDTLDPAIQEHIRSVDLDAEPEPMPPEIAEVVLGDDLTDEQFAWCLERTVAEAPRLTTEPVDLTPLAGVPATWLRTLGDLIVPAERQLRFAANVGVGDVVDLDAGHMCMVSQPEATAAVIESVVSSASA